MAKNDQPTPKRKKPVKEICRITGLYILRVIYHLTLGIYLKIRYRLRVLNNDAKKIKGAYVLVGNHVNNWDGCFMQYYIFRPIRFIVTDSIFRNKALRGLLRFAGYIPKRKFVSDIRTISKAIKTAKSGNIIGIFPEGMRCWDGRTVPVVPATAKLIKLLKVPVVVTKISGGYLSDPRWAIFGRRGRVELSFDLVLTADQVRTMDPNQIDRVLQEALFHDEYEWQQDRRIPFKGKNLARDMELLLFTCPNCKSLGCIRSEDNEVYCSRCEKKYRLDVYGYLWDAGTGEQQKTLAQLNEWQQENMRAYVSDKINRKQMKILFDDGAVLMHTNDPAVRYRPTLRGALILTRDSLIIKGADGRTVFSLEELLGVCVQFRYFLAFHHKSQDYRIRFTDKRVSAYKWESAMHALMKYNKEVN